MFILLVPFLIILLFILSILFVIRRSLIAGAFFLFASLLLNYCTQTIPFHPSFLFNSFEKKENQIRILSYNIKYNSDYLRHNNDSLSALISFFQQQDADIIVPFLDKEVINLALDIPGKFKIKNNEDLLRKHIIRDTALDIGVPEYIALRPKKAAQYGSGINKILKKKILKDFDIDAFVESLKEN